MKVSHTAHLRIGFYMEFPQGQEGGGGKFPQGPEGGGTIQILSKTGVLLFSMGNWLGLQHCLS